MAIQSDDPPARQLASALAAGLAAGQLEPQNVSTRLVHLGRDPFAHHGFVNPPVYRGSTVLYPTVASLEGRAGLRYSYGRKGSPSTDALEAAIRGIEGGHRTWLAPSGLAAVSTALLAFVEAGDHILMPDAVYQPARTFCRDMLTKLGVEVQFYDPLIAAGIGALIKPNTRVVYTESPGSQTFEVQDIPAIASAARAAATSKLGAGRELWVFTDNTWASPLYFKPFAHGVDVSIQAATKYVVGHADAMLGAITANERATDRMIKGAHTLGICSGSEETYLGLRGMRTLEVRLERHWRSGVDMARWLEARPEVDRVLHPALESHPGHAIWKRDFLGASGLFAVILKPAPKPALAAMLEGLQLFGMGFSWGGFESLVVPFDPTNYRTATKWQASGQALRFHIGLEDVADLKADLAAGFDRLAAHA